MNAQTPQRPRRSVLYMPGSNARAIEKARSLPADVVVMDLEDAVAPERKAQAREQVGTSLREGGFGYRECWVRVNALETPWGEDDLRMAVASGADALLLPKVNDRRDLEQARALIETMSSDTSVGATPPVPIALWAMIETPRALLSLTDIASCAPQCGLAGLVLGSNDLAKDLRLQPGRERRPLHYAMSLVVTTARAYGLQALDGVFNAIDDEDGLRAECEQGRDFGFDGKTLIHPAQLASANTVFSPSADMVADAYAIRAAFADPVNANAGVIMVNGKMTERLHLDQAEYILAIHEALQQQSAH